jgi:hypothetical protein
VPWVEDYFNLRQPGPRISGGPWGVRVPLLPANKAQPEVWFWENGKPYPDIIIVGFILFFESLDECLVGFQTGTLFLGEVVVPHRDLTLRSGELGGIVKLEATNGIDTHEVTVEFG